MTGGQAVDSLAPGTVLDGRYRIEAEIARGGMGVIYRATHVTLNLPRAVKLITPQFARDPRYLERFRTEATAAARIEHPNVVAVQDFGEVDGAPYLVMPYVEGVDLQRLVDREGAIEPERALRLLAQIADALDAAHAMGVVHRDVKPSNILVVGERALLTDFGLAKQLTAGPGGQSELLGGTLEYAAPEQLEGHPVDARTDVYSLGCVLLHMLTGCAPGIGHLWGDSSGPSVPPELDAVIARARARDPERRYGSAREFARTAEGALRAAPRERAYEPPTEDTAPLGRTYESPGPYRPAGETRLRPRRPPAFPPPPAPVRAAEDPWRRRRPWLLALAGVLALALAAGAGALVARGRSEPTPTPTPRPSPAPTVATATPTASPEPTQTPVETPTPAPTETPPPVSPAARRVEQAVRR